MTPCRQPRQSSLDLGLIGNGSIAALVDARARIVWGCVPAFDGDPVFCALLSPRLHDGGDYAIELEDMVSSEQEYLPNTAVLRTLLRDRTWRCRRDHRFRARAGASTIASIARSCCCAGCARLPGLPRIRIVPASALPSTALRKPEITWGSNHIRYPRPRLHPAPDQRRTGAR